MANTNDAGISAYERLDHKYGKPARDRRDMTYAMDPDGENSRPNVIWILGDQHRAQALSCNGDPNLHTPNLDRLATYGVNFTAAVSGYPLCSPFRGSMLTGLYPHKCVPGHNYPMPPGQQTIAHVFGDHGYRTAYFGKWHVGNDHKPIADAGRFFVPPEQRGGFDIWVDTHNNNSQWNTVAYGGEGENEFSFRLEGFATNIVTDMFIDYIQGDLTGKDERPFFAVLSVQPPHNPYAAPAEFMGRHNSAEIQLRPNVPDVPRVVERARRQLAGYYAQIENLDWNLGRIEQALEETGQRLNTHILFFSDHGDMQGSHGQFGKVLPYEESIRIPFIIGGEIPMTVGRKTGRVDAPINHVDIAPTTLGLCGIEAPDWMEGTDYSHYRLETSRKRTQTPAEDSSTANRLPPDDEPSSLYARARGDEPDSAFLQVPMPREHIDKPWRGIATRDGWKYVCFERQAWLMFNLNEDPYELVNLAHNSQFADKRKELNARLAQWIEETGDVFELPRR